MAEETIGGYRLKRHLVTGQTSQVWEVVEASSGRHFAMKLLLPEMAKISSYRNFLFHEADVGKKLAHPNIIKIVRVSRSQSTPHFVMEYFPSGNLNVATYDKKDEFISEHVLAIAKKSASAWAFMNCSVWVHRDVKPDNILVSSACEVRLIDFALAQRVCTGFWAKLFFRKRKAQGTRSYMSPEQIRGKPLDGRADIYSFAATVYELLTGRPPFRGNSEQDLLQRQIIEKPVSPMVHNPKVTTEISNLVLRMLAKKAEDRPKDFNEVLMALKSIRLFRD